MTEDPRRPIAESPYSFPVRVLLFFEQARSATLERKHLPAPVSLEAVLAAVGLLPLGAAIALSARRLVATGPILSQSRSGARGECNGLCILRSRETH